MLSLSCRNVTSLIMYQSLIIIFVFDKKKMRSCANAVVFENVVLEMFLRFQMISFKFNSSFFFFFTLTEDETCRPSDSNEDLSRLPD